MKKKTNKQYNSTKIKRNPLALAGGSWRDEFLNDDGLTKDEKIELVELIFKELEEQEEQEQEREM